MFKKSTEPRAELTREETAALESARTTAVQARQAWNVASEAVRNIRAALQEAWRRPAWEAAGLHKKLEAAQEGLDAAQAAIGPADEERKRIEREVFAQARERFAPMQAELVEAVKQSRIAELREVNARALAFTEKANAILSTEFALPPVGCPLVDKLEAWIESVTASIAPKKQAARPDGVDLVRILSFKRLRGLPPGFHPSNQAGDVVSVPAAVARQLVKAGAVELVGERA